MSGFSKIKHDLPAWAALNNASFSRIEISATMDKGMAVQAKEHISPPDTIEKSNLAPLLTIPRDLVLSAQAVDEYSKVDQNFKQLLEAAGGQSTRGDVMIYLLSHLVLSRGPRPAITAITPTPWTEYIRFLPPSVPVPTMWSENERDLLRGTSLEASLEAKLSVLHHEFDVLRERSATLPFWNDFFWNSQTVEMSDWILVDSWYRSRCLELPHTGTALVPGLDMANHSNTPTAFYDEDRNDDVLLLVRPGCDILREHEVTISYGHDKPAAEMLFNYGFVDKDSCSHGLTLSIEPFRDDPLAKAKLHAYAKPPILTLALTEGALIWHSPFCYLMCLNEEDGLDFRIIQDLAGERQLRVMWQEEDVTDRLDAFEELVQGHALCDVFKLRVVSVAHERVAEQASALKVVLDSIGPDSDSMMQHMGVDTLRQIELSTLETAITQFEEEKHMLLESEHVLRYLGSMEDTQNEQTASNERVNEETDFS